MIIDYKIGLEIKENAFFDEYFNKTTTVILLRK